MRIRIFDCETAPDFVSISVTQRHELTTRVTSGQKTRSCTESARPAQHLKTCTLLNAADIAGQLGVESAEDADRRALVRPNEERTSEVQITRRGLESARASYDPCCVSVVVA